MKKKSVMSSVVTANRQHLKLEQLFLFNLKKYANYEYYYNKILFSILLCGVKCRVMK